MGKSKIEWTDVTLNCVTGCTKVSPGCRFCYSETMTKRLVAMGSPKYAAGFGKVALHQDVLAQPLNWRKRRNVFVNSMADTFHRDVPDNFLDDLFAVMAICALHSDQRGHRFMLLTKRIDRALEYLTNVTPERIANAGGQMMEDSDAWWDELRFRMPWPLPNVWLGASIEDQSTADLRAQDLLRCPAALHFLSVEPMLADIRLAPHMGDRFECPECEFDHDEGGRGARPLPKDRYCGICAGDSGRNVALRRTGCGIDWVIAGCESGPHRRPCTDDWLRSLRDQCTAAGVPFFLKQQVDANGKLVKMPELDGRVWDQMPAGPEVVA